jgi:hypothetical protein
MRIAVTGGRELRDRDLVWGALDMVLAELGGQTFLLVHGAARGADTLAAAWALDRCCTPHPIPAIWRRPDGSRDLGAGHRRNAQLLALAPDQVLAFPGGSGTAGMVSMALRREIPVRRAYRRTTGGIALEPVDGQASEVHSAPASRSLDPLFKLPG